MKKAIIWISSAVIVIAIGVFAYDRYQQHVMGSIGEQLLRFVNEVMVEYDVLCTFDTNTSKCTCTPEANEAEETLTVKECLALAVEARTSVTSN